MILPGTFSGISHCQSILIFFHSTRQLHFHRSIFHIIEYSNSKWLANSHDSVPRVIFSVIHIFVYKQSNFDSLIITQHSCILRAYLRDRGNARSSYITLLRVYNNKSLIPNYALRNQKTSMLENCYRVRVNFYRPLSCVSLRPRKP